MNMAFTYIIYNTILFLVIVFSYAVEKSRNNLTEYGFRTILFLFMFFPAAIRKGIGTDYWNYVDLYNLYANHGDEHEIGFQFLGQILNWTGAHYQLFIISLAVLAIAPICYYVPKRHFAMFTIVYFFLVYVDIIGTSRQDISIACIVCGIFALFSQKGNVKYLLCAAIRFIFHYSSVLYLPLILFKKIKFSTFNVYLSLAIILLLTVGTSTIEWIFTNPLFFDSPYGVYVGSGYSSEANVGSGLGIIANLLIPFTFIILSPKIRKTYKNTGFFTLLTLIFIGSYLLASQIHIFGRLVNAFIFVPAFLIYPTCKAISSKYKKLIFAAFFLMYLILFEKTIAISQISLGSGLGISPYTTIFD